MSVIWSYDILWIPMVSKRFKHVKLNHLLCCPFLRSCRTNQMLPLHPIQTITLTLCIPILGNTRNHLSTVLSTAVKKKICTPPNPIDFTTSNPSPMHWSFFFLEQQLHGQLLTTSRAGSILKGNATPSSMCETHRNTAGDDAKLVLPQQLMACWILTLRWPPPTATTIVNLARKTMNKIWCVRPSMACSVWYTESREAFLRLLSLAGLADFT